MSETSVTVPRPSAAALRILREGVKAHISTYVRSGGSRHFPTEDAQDEANRWLDALEAAAKQ